MHRLWEFLNSPKTLEVTLAFLILAVLVLLGAGCVYYALSRD